VFLEFFFGANFIESGLAPTDTVAGISDAAALQGFLNLAIFAKGPVNCDEREIDIAWQLEVFVAHVDLHRFSA
jgi:hypothetical protein